jgi:hypothetical protein
VPKADIQLSRLRPQGVSDRKSKILFVVGEIKIAS